MMFTASPVPAVALLEKYGLDAAGIYKQIKAFI